jgi:uncharacterized membrane protein YfcA
MAFWAEPVIGGITAGQVVLLVTAAIVAGAARGFSGFGAALIFMPVASALIGPRHAAPLLLLIDGLPSLGLIRGAWTLADRRSVLLMTLGAAFGVPFGTAILIWADPLTLRWMMAGLVLALLLLLLSGWKYRGRPVPALTAFVGGTAGFSTGAAGIGGPPVMVYWLGGPTPAAIVRANIILYFAALSLLTATSYVTSGLFTAPVLTLAAVMTPAYALALFAGSRLFGRASERTFRAACYGLIAFAAITSLPPLDGLLR